jgi:hypothetical protein
VVASASKKEGIMAFRIQCLKCDTDTWAGNIVDLIDTHTDARGRFVCARCGETETYVAQITGRWEQEPGVAWERCLKGVIRVTADSPSFTPYVFLTADAPEGEVSDLRLSYYREIGPKGRRVDGPGPGSAPALTLDELRQLLVKLGAFGVLRPRELEVLAQLIRLDAPAYSLV